MSAERSHTNVLVATNYLESTEDDVISLTSLSLAAASIISDVNRPPMTAFTCDMYTPHQ